jgi:hypothetical protein
MSAYFAYTYDLGDFKLPPRALRLLKKFDHTEPGQVFVPPVLESILLKNVAFVMCGTTQELQKSFQTCPFQYLICEKSDSLCIHYARIKISTVETISLICVAPLTTWRGRIGPKPTLPLPEWVIPPKLIDKPSIFEAGFEEGWTPLVAEPFVFNPTKPQYFPGFSMLTFVSSFVPMGHSKQGWFEAGTFGGPVDPIKNRFYTQRGH